MEQNCISTNLPSRERGGRGPKIILPCTKIPREKDAFHRQGNVRLINSKSLALWYYICSKAIIFDSPVSFGKY